MVHYPSIIEMSGPFFFFFWSMCFKAKHKELKDTANSITSWKNIVLSPYIVIKTTTSVSIYTKFTKK